MTTFMKCGGKASHLDHLHVFNIADQLCFEDKKTFKLFLHRGVHMEKNYGPMLISHSMYLALERLPAIYLL